MFDLAIIGGGINGCGIARDAAGRGLRVLLVEKGDLASGTSSASTKLIHGGLRYLENYEFRLVRDSLAEREVLWAMAPNIVRPMRFVLPHRADMRSAWLLRLGLLLYDHLGGRRLLPRSRHVDLRRDPAGSPLEPSIIQGFEYSDCWVDDARLVVLNAVDAARLGADVRVATEMSAAHREAGQWAIELSDHQRKESRIEHARVLVNAAGPWGAEMLADRLGHSTRARIRLVKGSHIVVHRLFDHDRAYILQNGDGRVVFAIPYEHDFTLIGTTDVDFAGDPADVEITEAEVAYLCDASSKYLKHSVTPDQVVWTFSGVRSLYDDGAAAQDVTRDYVLELDAADGQAPLLSIFGGKITTYRRLAEAALGQLAPWLRSERGSWTRGAPLPGGDFPVDELPALAASLVREHPWLAAPLAARYAHAYGTQSRELLLGCSGCADLGRCFGADLYEREVEWMIAREWALTADDVLWRRSKLGLRLAPAQRQELVAWMASRLKAPAVPPRQQ